VSVMSNTHYDNKTGSWTEPEPEPVFIQRKCGCPVLLRMTPGSDAANEYTALCAAKACRAHERVGY
jgi:hypothetical protein